MLWLPGSVKIKLTHRNLCFYELSHIMCGSPALDKAAQIMTLKKKELDLQTICEAALSVNFNPSDKNSWISIGKVIFKVNQRDNVRNLKSFFLENKKTISETIKTNLS